MNRRLKTQPATFLPSASSVAAAESLKKAENLVAVYLDATASDLPELDRALARGDVLKVASMAHRLKRAAAEAGADDLSQAAARIEACYRQGAFEILPYQVDAFCRAQRTYRFQTT
jgi:HPt (histidine-containing phosphotransfer) domain-containing protein